MSVPLSVLDLIPLADGSNSRQALRNSLELARRADQLGYTRYWFAEHHNMPTVVSTTPEIMIAMAAEQTEYIRVGSGGRHAAQPYSAQSGRILQDAGIVASGAH